MTLVDKWLNEGRTEGTLNDRRIEAALAALKHAFSPEPKDLKAALEPLRRLDATTDFLLGLLRYVVQTSPPAAEGDIIKVITRPRNRELVMTLVDKWLNEGRTQGRTEGTLNDRREVLIRQPAKKFGLNDEERRLIEGCEDLDRLASALDEILFAETKRQVLAKLRP